MGFLLILAAVVVARSAAVFILAVVGMSLLAMVIFPVPSATVRQPARRSRYGTSVDVDDDLWPEEPTQQVRG